MFSKVALSSIDIQDLNTPIPVFLQVSQVSASKARVKILIPTSSSPSPLKYLYIAYQAGAKTQTNPFTGFTGQQIASYPNVLNVSISDADRGKEKIVEIDLDPSEFDKTMFLGAVLQDEAV